MFKKNLVYKTLVATAISSVRANHQANLHLFTHAPHTRRVAHHRPALTPPPHRYSNDPPSPSESPQTFCPPPAPPVCALCGKRSQQSPLEKCLGCGCTLSRDQRRK